MNQKFMIREFGSIEKFKLGLGKDKVKEQEDIKQGLEHLSGCITEMTKQMKDMKENQNKTQKLEEPNMDQTQNTLKHLTECVIEMTKELKEMKRENLNKNEKRTDETQNTMKQLADCIIQMNKELKEIRKDNQDKSQKKVKLKIDQWIPQQYPSLDSRMEKRFQDVDISIPDFDQKDDEKKRLQIIFDWIAKLCKVVFSIGFNLYESGVLDINKVKAYCSENLIRNFIKFFKKNKPTPEEIGKINNFLVDDLLPYFCLKYPESEEAETSAKFSSGLIQRDDMDNNDYDLVYKSGVDFSEQESGNYNSQIMKFLNYIISLTEKSMPVKYSPGSGEKQKDKDKDKDNKPLNKLFVQDMGNIFRMVEIEENVLRMQMFDPKNPEKKKKQAPNTEISQPKQESGKEEQDEMEKQKKRKEKEYREKVLSYTSFQIGQKLSSNLKQFSNSDIESENLTLSSSDVIRALTKWAEELEKCYKKEYFYERDAPFRMKDGSLRYLSSDQTYKLYDSFSKQSEKIETIKKEIRQNNNKNQSMLMGEQTYQRLVRLSEDEASVGQFASSIFKNNITYLISYLNALIHGIHQSINLCSFLGKEKTPQLITFSIGDLMRCKCSSKENEIIALYKEIERRHRQPDSGIKIIRVKNRLNKGNKDILMNLLYRGEMVVEMQLVIKSDKSKFIECSYNFNHYLYELRRAQFGPIMEMCNVWMNKDSKGKFYLERMEELNVRNKKKVEQNKKDLQKRLQDCCTKNKKQMKLPFRCSSCDCFFSASSLLENNIQCKKCQKFTCYLCQLQVLNAEMKKFLKQIPEIQNKEVVPYQKIQKETGGVLVKLKSRKKKSVVFTISEYKKKFYMFECDETKKGISLIQKFDYQQIPVSFLKQHLVLSAGALKNKISKFNQEYRLTIQKYFIEENLKEAYKTEKTSISLKYQELSKQMLEIQKIANWPHIKKINFSDNKNMSLQKIMEKFPNVEVAVLSQSKFSLLSLENSMKQKGASETKKIQSQDPQDATKIAKINQQNQEKSSLRQFGYFQHLKQLQIQWVNMSELPQHLCHAKLLQKLNISNNRLTKLPPSITQLQKLQILNIRSNWLQSLPEDIGKIKSLRKLELSYNKFKEIPDSLCDLSQLTQLILVSNKINNLPDKIGNLANLRILKVSLNQIENITQNICNLRQLRILELSNNGMKLLPQNFGNLTNLQHLDLQSNLMKSLPQNFGNLVNLQQLNLQNNQLNSLPQHFGNLASLQILYLFNNQLNLLPQHFGNLASLRCLYLKNNRLKQLPQHFGNLTSLSQLDLTSNRLKSLPQHFGNLPNLQKLDLQLNQLKSLPQHFGNLKNLQKLDLQNNQLVSLPQSVGNLTNLWQFDLQKNKLESLPQNFGNMTGLKYLYLRDNQLKSLPQNFGNLANLWQMDVQNNQLESLPQNFGNLTNIWELELKNNRLKLLPQHFGNMATLQHLNLSNNQLNSLPEHINNLTSLKKLDLQNNQLSIFNQELWQLPKLQRLILSNNKFQSLPELRGDNPNLRQLILSNNQLKQLPSSISHLKSLTHLNLTKNNLQKIPQPLKDLKNLLEIDFKQNQITEIPSWLLTPSKLKKICFSILTDLTFPADLWKLRYSTLNKFRIQIEYVQRYEKLALDIKKQQTAQTDIQIKKIKQKKQDANN